MMLLHMNALASKHGFLDGQARRDNIPDLRVNSTLVRVMNGDLWQSAEICV